MGVGGAQYSETIVDVELSLVQKHHYRAILEQHRPMLRKVLAGLEGTSQTPLLDASKHTHTDKGLGQLDEGVRARGGSLHGLARVGERVLMPAERRPRKRSVAPQLLEVGPQADRLGQVLHGLCKVRLGDGLVGELEQLVGSLGHGHLRAS